MKLAPDQLHRLIDEVAALAYRRSVDLFDMVTACMEANCFGWWMNNGIPAWCDAGEGFAGLSAVLILLSEGGVEMSLKAYVIDECEIYAAETCHEAMALYEADVGHKAHIGELVDESLLDIESPALDEDENPTGAMTTIRKELSDMTEPGWMGSCEVF